MKAPQIRFSADGPAASRLALGAWRLADARLTREDIRALVHQALEAGITTIDHADIYGRHACQRLFGDALAGDAALRDQMQLVTKCGVKLIPATGSAQRVKYYDTSRAHILASVDDSLEALRTDRVEMLLIHRSDPMLDPDEVAEAFEALKKAGKALHFGVSNFTPSQFDLLASRLPFGLVTNQLQFSVLHTSPLYEGTFDQCLRLRISPMAWSPLDGGRLLKEEDERARRVRRALGEVGRELGGAAIEQVALAWILAHPARIIPIVGTTNRERLKSAAAAVGLSLSREQWFFILEASAGGPVP
ncbi:MAG: aldo/keto reductase [Verrucomicrobiota bacterium]|jgi:predicted oxidoreductase